MPPKKNYSISEHNLSQIDTENQIAELRESYSIGGFDLNERKQDWNWDSEDYGYDSQSY